MRIMPVIHHQRPAKAVTVLSSKVAVVPERAYYAMRRLELQPFPMTQYWSDAPAWSGTRKSYRNELPVVIGH